MSVLIRLKKINLLELNKKIYRDSVIQNQFDAQENIEIEINSTKINKNKFSLLLEISCTYHATFENKSIASISSKYLAAIDIENHNLKDYNAEEANNIFMKNKIITSSIKRLVDQFIIIDIRQELLTMGISSDLPMFTQEIEI